jgi:hypothetical protein
LKKITEHRADWPKSRRTPNDRAPTDQKVIYPNRYVAFWPKNYFSKNWNCVLPTFYPEFFWKRVILPKNVFEQIENRVFWVYWPWKSSPTLQQLLLECGRALFRSFFNICWKHYFRLNDFSVKSTFSDMILRLKIVRPTVFPVKRSFYRKIFPPKKLDRTRFHQNTIWPNAIWPIGHFTEKSHLTERLFYRKVISPIFF